MSIEFHLSSRRVLQGQDIPLIDSEKVAESEKAKEKEVDAINPRELTHSIVHRSTTFFKKKQTLSIEHVKKKAASDHNIMKKPLTTNDLITTSLKDLTPRTYTHQLITSLFKSSPRERARDFVSYVFSKDGLSLNCNEYTPHANQRIYSFQQPLERHLLAFQAIKKELDLGVTESQSELKKNEHTWTWFCHLHKKWADLLKLAEQLIQEEEEMNGIPLYTKKISSDNIEWISVKNKLSLFLCAIKDFNEDIGRKEIFYAAMGGSFAAESMVKTCSDVEEQRILFRQIFKQCHRINETEKTQNKLQDTPSNEILERLFGDFGLLVPAELCFSKIIIRTKADKTRLQQMIIRPQKNDDLTLEALGQYYKRVFESVYRCGFLQFSKEDDIKSLCWEHVQNIPKVEISPTPPNKQKLDLAMEDWSRCRRFCDTRTSLNYDSLSVESADDAALDYMKDRKKIYDLVPCFAQLQQLTPAVGSLITDAAKQLWPTIFAETTPEGPSYPKPLLKKPENAHVFCTRRDQSFQIIGEICIEGPRQAKTYHRQKHDFILRVFEPEKKLDVEIKEEKNALKAQNHDLRARLPSRYRIKHRDIYLGHIWLQLSISFCNRSERFDQNSPWKIHLKVTELFVKKDFPLDGKINKDVITQIQRKIIDEIECYTHDDTILSNGHLLQPGIKSTARALFSEESKRLLHTLNVDEVFDCESQS